MSRTSRSRMEATFVNQTATLIRTGRVPRLESGDHLTLAEFERRYDAMPGLKKAELIEGVVYMGSPVRLNEHGMPHAHCVTWLGIYSAATPGVKVGDNFSIRLDNDNMPQPDAALIVDPARGGRVVMSDDGYVEGAPELIAEVAASTASIDLNTKLRIYRRNGVLEYVVWRVLDGAIDWFILRQGQYEQLQAGADGISRSEVFQGLWLDLTALIAENLAGVLDVGRRGLASPEHAEFVARLAARGG